MSLSLDFHPAVRDEIDDAHDWYEQTRLADQEAAKAVLPAAMFADESFAEADQTLPLPHGLGRRSDHVQLMDGDQFGEFDGVVLVGLAFDVFPLPGLAGGPLMVPGLGGLSGGSFVVPYRTAYMDSFGGEIAPAMTDEDSKYGRLAQDLPPM